MPASTSGCAEATGTPALSTIAGVEPLSFRTCAAFISVSIRACAAGRAACPSIIARISPRSASDSSEDKGRAPCSLCPRLGSHQTHIKQVGVAPAPRFLGASHLAQLRLTDFCLRVACCGAVTQVAVGIGHTCALRAADAEAVCWGAD